MAPATCSGGNGRAYYDDEGTGLLHGVRSDGFTVRVDSVVAVNGSVQNPFTDCSAAAVQQIHLTVTDTATDAAVKVVVVKREST